MTKRGAPTPSHPLPQPLHTFEAAIFFCKPGMQSLIVSRWDPTQPITVCVCETAPLRSALLLPLLCPTRPIKSRIWPRRRGTTYSPCYATLSGWRLWAGTPFTKSLFLKTSTRFLIYPDLLHLTPQTHITSNCTLSVYMTVWLFFFLSGFWFHVQSGFTSREDGPPSRVVQCL